ncbi:MAG: hypothetical protein EBY77_04580 [Rhodobacteraceae bacterium]|nr:hypothetical protein [Paracoccaceae bacterium]
MKSIPKTDLKPLSDFGFRLVWANIRFAQTIFAGLFLGLQIIQKMEYVCGIHKRTQINGS